MCCTSQREFRSGHAYVHMYTHVHHCVAYEQEKQHGVEMCNGIAVAANMAWCSCRCEIVGLPHCLCRDLGEL